MTESGNKSLEMLEAALLAAHDKSDLQALVVLYRQAGEAKEQDGDLDAACFYYTHAFVFALETGHPDRHLLNSKLVGFGREEPL